jgi:nucleotide-binding universal stress UspA family protein
MKILLAIDGSPHSEAAVAEVARRPWPARTELEVLAVVHAGGPMLPDPAFVMAAVHVVRTRDLEQRARHWVAQAAAQVRHGVPNATVTTKVLEGLPKHVIVQEARDWGADLIVLGSHGYGAIRRAVLGSVATAVVTDASCSVEVVRVKSAA